MPNDLRNRESGSGIGGGSDQHAYDDEFQHLTSPAHYSQDAAEPEIVQGAAGGSLRDDLKDEIKDRALEEAKNRAKESLKGGKGGTGTGTGTGGTSAAGAGDAAASGAGGAGASGAGAGGAGAAGAGGAAAGEGAAAGAGAAGAGAAGAGGAAAGAGAGGAAAGAGAGAAAAGTGAAAAAGTGAAAAGTGAAATGAAAGVAGAGVATGAGVAATTGVETLGVGAVVGIAIAGAAIVGGFVIKYRKEIAALCVVGFVGVLLIFTALLNGLKPIASTLQTTQKFMSPVQQIVDNRAVEVIGRFVTGGSGAALAYDAQQKEQVAKTNAANAGDGQVLAATTDGVVNTGKLKTLFDAMKADGLEDRLKQKYGIEFKAVGGGIDMSRYGKSFGVAKNGTEAAEYLRLGFPELPRFLSEDAPYWSWAQFNKGSLNMKGQYDVPTLSVPDGESAYDSSKLTEVVKYQFSTILRTGLTNMKRGIACFTGGTECNDFGVPVQGEAVAEYQNDNRSSLTATTQAAYDENLKNVSVDNGYDSPRLDTSAGQKVTEQLEQKTVGLLGWLDIAATTKAMSEKEGAQQLPALLRGKQAGSLWLWNTSAVNQMLAKDMTSPASSLITRNYQSIEESQAYNYIAYNDPLRGQGLSETQKINSKLKQAFSYFYQSLIIENPIIQGVVSLAFQGWLFIHSGATGFLIDLAARTPLGTFIDRFAGFILNQIGVLEFVGQILGISSKAVLPVCDPADKSYNFLNCFASGAKNAANFLCVKSFGCANMTVAQENEVKYASAMDMQKRLAFMPLQKRLFDAKVPNSFVNVAAMNSPLPIKATNNLASMFQGVFGAVWNAPGKVASLAAAPARAAGQDADSSLIDGQETMGIPLSTIQTTPLSEEVSNDQGTCPETKLGEEVNMCMADDSTVDVMICLHTHNPTCGRDGAATPEEPGSANAGDAAALAKEILAKADAGTIKFWHAGSREDLQNTAAGKKVENQCGGFVNMSAPLLYVINEAAKKYTFMITAMNSDHGCGSYHAEGKAVDFDMMNLLGKNPVDADGNLGGALWKGFATDIVKAGLSVSQTVGLGQEQYMGKLSGFNGLTQGNDSGTHLHFSIGGRSGSF